MRQKKRLLLAAAAGAALLTGCAPGGRDEETSGYKVYYVDASGIRLQDVSYVPAAETFDELMEELIGQLSDDTGLYGSLLRQGVKLLGYQRGIDALRIDFSGEYYALDHVQEVLLRAAVVKTFSQVPGVQRIMITVNGEQLTDENGEPVPAMNAESFIDTREGGINSYRYATLSLYFAGEDGEQLVRERRSLQYSSNMVLENVVLEQLLSGPQEEGKLPLFTPETTVLGIQVRDGECIIDLSEKAQETPSGIEEDPVTVLYAVVNSICDTCDDITSVRFTVEGENTEPFRGKVSLDAPFWLNPSLVEQEEQTVYAVPVGVDPRLAQSVEEP